MRFPSGFNASLMRFRAAILMCTLALTGTSTGASVAHPVGAIAGSSALKLTTPTAWTESVLYSFTGPSDGDGVSPGSSLIATQGAFYGTSFYGGTTKSTSCYSYGPGCGTVFRLTPRAGRTGWTESVLYSFTDTNGDGDLPQAGLIADAHGNLYGTTYAGGNTNCGYSLGCGTVFKVSPPRAGQTGWTESVLYSFTASSLTDGAHPQAGLIADAYGNLYGTTYVGGNINCGCGTVFKLAPPAAGQTTWAESVLYAFGSNGNGDGVWPEAGLIADTHGVLYGTTFGGGKAYGSVFKLTPPARGQTGWTESVLYSFTTNGNSDGRYPHASLIVDRYGNLYGTTYVGGGSSNCPALSSLGCGTVFKLSPPTAGQTVWTESVLHSFTNTDGDGAGPVGGLIGDGSGALYGTTDDGGGSTNCGNLGCGTVFKLNPPARGQTAWIESVLHSFTGVPNDGGNPVAGLIRDSSSGALFGTTQDGGTVQAGTVFKLVQ
jgi:uncharacterized repeat protein (TIGR03803 family)